MYLFIQNFKRVNNNNPSVNNLDMCQIILDCLLLSMSELIGCQHTGEHLIALLSL